MVFDIAEIISASKRRAFIFTGTMMKVLESSQGEARDGGESESGGRASTSFEPSRKSRMASLSVGCGCLTGKSATG